jgi:hypothetical protein
MRIVVKAGSWQRIIAMADGEHFIIPEHRGNCSTFRRTIYRVSGDRYPTPGPCRIESSGCCAY